MPTLLGRPAIAGIASYTIDRELRWMALAGQRK
jgi:hypothetical protein